MGDEDVAGEDAVEDVASDDAAGDEPYPPFMSQDPAKLRELVGSGVTRRRGGDSVGKTRSQRMRLRATVRASSTAFGTTLSTNQYVGGTVFMQPGNDYVAAICTRGELQEVVSWKALIAEPQAGIAETSAMIDRKLKAEKAPAGIQSKGEFKVPRKAPRYP